MVLRAHTQTSYQFARGFWPPCIFWTPAKCEVAHTSLPFSPSKVSHSDIYLAPGGGTWHQNQNQLGSYLPRDGSCDGVDHPNDHGGPRFGCAELVSGLRSSTFAVVLRGPQAAPRIERRAPWLTRMMTPEDSSAPPSAALLPSSERCRFFDQSRKRPDPPCECASTTGPGFATTREEAPREQTGEKP